MTKRTGMVERLVGAPGIVRGAAHARRPRSKRDPRTPALRLDRAVAMQSGESIYNLIPQPEVVPARPPMHKSKHPGEVDPRDFGMESKRAYATFGRSPGSLKPKTSEFLRKTNPEDTLRSRASNGPPDLPPGPAPREFAKSGRISHVARSPPRPRPARRPPERRRPRPRRPRDRRAAFDAQPPPAFPPAPPPPLLTLPPAPRPSQSRPTRQ